MKKYHYVYEITYTDSKKYIGSRSSDVSPEEDTKYIGSSRHAPNDKVAKKIILGEFSSRELALEYEVYLHNSKQVHISKEYYNRACQTSVKFSTAGLTKENCKWVTNASKKRSKYKGDNRTEAQKLGTLKMVKTNTGVKNPAKGRKGAESNRFKPWYIKTPTGEYKVFKNTTISEFLETEHSTPFNRGSIFYATISHEHSLLTAGMAKGWTVGFLPIPKNHLISIGDRPSTKTWWYKTPDGKTTTIFGIPQEVYCLLGFVPGLTRGIIKKGNENKRPYKNGKFKGWSFGID